MTREQAIERVGIELVEAVEKENCDFTNRITNGTEWQGYCEFSASLKNDLGTVVVYYYQKEEDVDATEDLGSLDWEIDHYDVVD